MSGGRLVVLDRSGRDIKHYPLPSGLVTLGRDHDCDIRIMLSSVSPHHATVVVHANQTVLRSMSDGKTLVNGQSVSVAALRHNDVITIGDRSLRWEYEDTSARRPLAAEPALDSSVRTRNGREARRATAGGGAAPRSRQLQLELELRHRASMPGNAGGKQVAVVQPQRRDTSEQSDSTRSPTSSPRHKRPRAEPETEPEPEPEPELHPEPQPEPERPARKCSPRGTSHTPVPRDTTKATLWIESRKSSPRKSAKVQEQTPPAGARQAVVARRVASAKKCTPLRVAVLRHVQSALRHRSLPAPAPAPRVTKILAPDVIDHTKQAAIMLMTGHTPKSKITPKQTKRTPSYVVKRPSPLPRTPRPPRGSGSGPRSIGTTPSRGTSYDNTGRSSSSRSGHSVSVLEITDSDATNSTIRASTASRRSKISPLKSPLLPSPKKSALKDPKAKKSIRKTESIKFDLSNLESHTDDLSDALGQTESEDDITLHYSDASSTQSPSPRKSIHSRSSRMLEKLGTSIESRPESVVLSPESPRARKSLRGSIMVQKALETPGNNTTGYSRRTTKSAADESWDTTVESAFKTRTLSLKSARNLESYSIVDLVSNDSKDSTKSASIYDSVGSTRCSSIMFGTPRNSRRKTRSTIDATLLTSSTPYVERRRATRSNSNPNISKSSPNKTTRSSTSRRSKSLSTPENTEKHISVNSTSVSRVSRTGSPISENDISMSFPNKTTRSSTSRRSKSLSTPENTEKHVSVNSTRVSRVSRTRSRIGESDISQSSPNKTTRSSTSRRSKSLSTPENIEKHISVNSTRVSRVSRTRSRIGESDISQSSPNKTTRNSTSRRSKSLSTPENTEQHISANSTRVSRVSRNRSRIDESDLQFISLRFEDDADDSPKTSKRPSRATKNSPNSSSPKNKRASRRNMTINTSVASEDGMTTPDQRNSPEEPGTPVLNIQSLLDSTHNSFSFRSNRKSMSKRKTIGVIRSERRKTRSNIKSNSLNLSARNLRLSKDSAESNKTDENCLRPDNEDIVTPKSAIKLVPEAVKNKHSTAKKPQSKRSIIDNLNESLQESDIVKQLFNSPVKRKLSQSMTEFSRKQLFDDDVPRRPTRNTVALTGRTPDNSLLSHTGDLTPGNSPNLTGIKRLFNRTTPENDLRNIKGVKGLLRTPRTRKSVKNDLTKVSGIKNVFAKSPKNRLSDVRVKEVFAASPRNDLRRVTGVKSLFQSKKKQNSPKNDLSDVRGVRSLYQRKSVANDLRNVSGVKKVLRASPKNDLTDVRGVRRMFRQEKQNNDYSDVSGVEELFNESNNTHTDQQNSLFDQLLGKPKIKAVYSKSFHNKKTTKKSANRSAKCLHNSIDMITNHVEEWLEQELQKRLHKHVPVQNPSESRISLSKSTTRELQKLMTDTVEGTAPICSSRIRNGTNSQAETSDHKKSASEVYSAHTLPIKKRSLIDASEKRSDSKILPIKKRAVVHSTPVKGRYNLTMNASELARVSPIASIDKTNLDPDTTIRSSQPTASPKPKGRRVTKIRSIIEDETAVTEPNSPKRKTNAKELDTLTIHVPSPKQAKRSTRGTPLSPKQTKAIEKTLQSPQAKRAIEEILKSPQAKRATRGTLKSPQAKRATKNAPKSPQVKEATKNAPKSPHVKEATKNAPKSPQVKGATKNAPKSPQVKEATKDAPKSPRAKRATRGKATAPKEEITIERKTRRTRNNTEKQEIQPPKSPKPKGRARNKTEKQETQVSPKPKGKRNTKAIEQKVEQPKTSPKKTRARKTIQTPAQTKSTRSRRNKTDINETQTKKGRPSLVITKKPPILSPKGPKTTKAIESPKPRSTRRKIEVDKPKTPKTPKKTRATATKNTVIVSKPSPQLKPQGSKTRGKKAQIIKSPTPKKQESPKKSPPKRGRRKASAVEEPKTKRGRNTKQSVDTEPQPKRTRNARTNEIQLQQQSLQETKPRGKKLVAQESVQSEPVRSNRGKNALEPIADLPTRGRKRKADDIVSPKVIRTRGKAAEIQVKSPKGKQKKESKPDKSKKEEVVEKTTRGRAAKGKVDEAKPVRGKKAAAAVVESVPEPSRKRKTNSTASPARVPVKRTRGARAVEAVVVAESNPRGRPRRNDTDKAVPPAPAPQPRRTRRR